MQVNLSKEKVTKDAFVEADARKFLGGRGLAVKMLFDELESGIDPLGPENKLVYSTGPFVGTGFPLNSRWIVAAKSPWGENDVVDHVMLHAKSHHPEMLKHSKEDFKKMIKDA